MLIRDDEWIVCTGHRLRKVIEKTPELFTIRGLVIWRINQICKNGFHIHLDKIFSKSEVDGKNKRIWISDARVTISELIEMTLFISTNINLKSQIAFHCPLRKFQIIIDWCQLILSFWQPQSLILGTRWTASLFRGAWGLKNTRTSLMTCRF